MLYEVTIRINQAVDVMRLNPYSNGICSMRFDNYVYNFSNSTDSLNPYSNGICSMRCRKVEKDTKVKSRLKPYSNGICSMSLTYINILFTNILDNYDIECINIFLPKTGLF